MARGVRLLVLILCLSLAVFTPTCVAVLRTDDCMKAIATFSFELQTALSERLDIYSKSLGNLQQQLIAQDTKDFGRISQRISEIQTEIRLLIAAIDRDMLGTDQKLQLLENTVNQFFWLPTIQANSTALTDRVRLKLLNLFDIIANTFTDFEVSSKKLIAAPLHSLSTSIQKFEIEIHAVNFKEIYQRNSASLRTQALQAAAPFLGGNSFFDQTINHNVEILQELEQSLQDTEINAFKYRMMLKKDANAYISYAGKYQSCVLSVKHANLAKIDLENVELTKVLMNESFMLLEELVWGARLLRNTYARQKLQHDPGLP